MRGILRLVAACAAVSLAICAPRASSDTLTLKEEVFVKGPVIHVSEIADIDGMQAVRLGEIQIGVAPMPGDTRGYDAALVSARLRKEGVDLDKIEMRGAKQVQATTLHTEISQQFLADSLRDFILAAMPWDEEETQIDLSAPANNLVLPDGDVEVEWKAPPNYRYVGTGAFRGDVKVDGHSEKTILCRANIVAYAEVVVASRDIPRGRPIGPYDVEFRSEPIDPAKQGLMLAPDEVIGLVARKTIFPGQPLTSRNTQLPIVIRRNQLVSVEIKAGALLARSQAVALMDASVGDFVRCKNIQSKQEIQGVVRRDGVVEVR